MKLYLIRHADAIDPDSEGVISEEFRYITSKGRSATKSVAKFIKDSGEFDSVEKYFTSPYTRAVQTAEIFATCLKFTGEVSLAEELQSGGSIAGVSKFLERNKGYSSIAVFGHEPMMSLIIASLSDKKNPGFEFKKSAVALIDFTNAGKAGKFKWYLNPKKLEYTY
ncbi:histidine phosphatase family protein [soil metagenome]